jgi:hypothetical protein
VVTPMVAYTDAPTPQGGKNKAQVGRKNYYNTSTAGR